MALNDPIRAAQLANLGITNANKLEPQAENLINNLTDEEFHAILTVRAKITPANWPAYDNTIRTMGF